MRGTGYLHAQYMVVYQVKYDAKCSGETFRREVQSLRANVDREPCFPYLYDMHCHLDFAENCIELAEGACRAGVRAFSTTVDPRDYGDACRSFANAPGIAVGLGLHPWWLADGRCSEEEVGLFVELASHVRHIGEVGLDFSPRRAGTFELQRAVFKTLMEACGGGNRLFSFHSVRSASALLDVVEETGVLGGSVAVMHWFSGSGEELSRAVGLRCLFSIGSRMLATRRGRAYARSLPLDRLLLETDLPNDSGERLDLDVWRSDLEGALAALAEIRGMELDRMRELLAANSEAALVVAR